MQFSDLELDPNLLKAIEEAGYSEPTPIQTAAIPHALRGRDVLGIAQTGTGKTASFTLPMIHMLAKGRAKARMPRSLILCPTRELAAQVAENFEKYGKYHKLTMALLIGGVNFNQQDKLIDRGVDVLIATPGRLLDHFERGKLMLTGIQIMVVDEADRMLDMGFIPDIERIFKLTPFTRQTLFFSATMPPEIQRLTDTFLQNPEQVEVAKQASPAETVSQTVFPFRPSAKERADREKRALLRKLIRAEGDSFKNAIIFCNRKRDVGVLLKSLQKHGLNAGALHGDLDQSVRMATLKAFRDGELDLLVASDVAARGLDIPDVSHVFNFDVPTHPEDYVHRIGRTGRAGKSGTALTICLPHEHKYLDRIEELVGGQIPRAETPDVSAEESSGKPARDGRKGAEKRAEKGADKRESKGAGKRGEKRGEERAEPAPEKAARKAPSGEGAGAPAKEPARDREERPARGKRGGRGRRREQADEPVVGMGDHVPAFLLREVRPRKLAKTERSGETGDGEGGDGSAESAAA
jgi:superfamily II DNA/RNA helicase